MRELNVNNVIIIRFKNLIITCSMNELLKTIDYKLAIFCIDLPIDVVHPNYKK